MPEERDEYGGVAIDAAPQVDEYGGQLVPERTMLPEVPRVPEEAGARIMGAGEPLLTLPRLEATDPRFQAFLTGLTGRPPSMRAAENVAAAANVAKTLPEFLTSPLGAATAPIAAAGGLPARLLGLGFAGQMAAGVPEAAREAGRVSVEGTPQEQKEALLGLGANIALPAALAAPALARRGLVRPAPEEIRPAPTPAAPEAAPVAPAPAPTPLTAAEQAAERARLAEELGQAPTGEFERVTKAQEAFEAKKEAALGKGQYVSVLEQAGLTKSQLANVGTLSLAEVKELSWFANAGELNRENFATRLRQAKEIAARGAKTEAIDIASEVTPAPSILQLGPVPEVSVEPVSPAKPKVAVKNLDYGKRRVEKRIGDKWDDENSDDLAFPIVPAIDDISLEAARKLNPNAQPGEMVVVDIKRNGDLEVRRVKESSTPEVPTPKAIPSLEEAHKGAPPVPENQIAIRVRMPNGNVVPGVWSGYQEAPGFPKFDKKPYVATTHVEGKWSHGILPPGAEILDPIPTFEEWKSGVRTVPKAKEPAPPEEAPAAPTYTGADAIEIVGKPLGEWFKAKTAADLPKGAQRVELAGRIRAKSTKPKDILNALKNEQDRIRRVVTEMAKPPLSPEEAIPMVQPTPTPPTATETTPPVPAAEMPKTPTVTGMRPAIRMVGGKVVVGDAGQTHPQIIRKNKIKAKEIDQRGFVDEQGNFHDREQTAAITGQPTEREPGRQHSTDLPEAKRTPVLTKADEPVVLTPKGKVPPNSAVIEVVDYNGRIHAKVVLPHDGTPEGAIGAAKKLRAYADQNFEWKTELYHTNTRYGATDASGNLKWVISPNAANIAEVGTPQARYILGDLSAAPGKVGTAPPVLPEPTAPPETPPQAAARPPLPKLVSDVLARSDRDANWVWMHATAEEKAAVDQWIVNTKHPSATQPGTPESRFKALVSEQTGPGPIGMGAAVSEEFEHDPRTPTGIRNAIVDKERVKRGLPEAMKAARRSFGEVWDRAMALIDRDPTTQDELLNTLRDKPRALTDTEDALVLHRQIDLQNEYGKATRDLAQAFDDGRLDDVARERVRVASLADKLLDIYNIGKTSGTETARGLSARRMMANEDFTLARMVTEKRAANQGKPLTDAQNAEIERLNKIIERTQKALDDFQKREAERRGGGPPPTTPPRIDPELERIKADNERAKREYREGLTRDRLKERTPAEKAMDWLVQLRQGFVLSGPTTLAKLVSAAIQRMVFTPTEEVVGAGLSKVIPSVASKAAREGGINARAEARAITEGFTAGMRDAWDVMRTGRSSLDIVYGKGMRYPMAIPGLKYIGFLHGALKSATKRNEFARSFEKRASAAIAQGVDVSDPFVQASIGLEAYKDANRSIFLQDNRVVTAYKAALATLEKRARDTGKTPLAAKSIATTGKILLPIVRVPTNIVAETLQYATGSITGSARLARAFAKGIENLQPAEADIIMRNLKKGSIGAAVLALGYLNADVIGGYYEPGKRKPQDVPFGRVRVYGHDIPSYLLHNPLLETLQVGATLRRLAESKLSKKDAEAQGIGWGIVGAGMGLLEEVPFLRETVELAKTFRAGERRQFLGELLKSLTVPQGVQWLAATQDVDQYGRPISRKPRTLAESVKTGIPGLREEVPVRPPPKR